MSRSLRRSFLNQEEEKEFIDPILPWSKLSGKSLALDRQNVLDSTGVKSVTLFQSRCGIKGVTGMPLRVFLLVLA